MDIEGIFLRLQLKLDDVNAALNNLEKDLTSRFAGLGDQFSTLGIGLTAALTLPLAAIGKVGLTAFGDFEASMKRVEGVTQGTAAQMKMLADQAIELGIKTQFSGKEAADAMGNLAAKGFSVNEIFGSMPGVLALAAAGQLSMGKAAEYAAGILRGFSLPVERMNDVTNALAKAAVSGGASISELATSFRYVGPIASVAGASIEQVAAALSIMAESGIKGQKGGTGLRAFFKDLIDPSKRAAEAIEELGLKFKDSSGKLLPMRDLIAQLAPHMNDLQSMTRIFGVHMSEVIPLLKKGAEGFDLVTSSIKNAEQTNFGDNLAKKMHEGWKGAFDDLKSSTETLMIAIGKILADVGVPFIKNFIEPMINGLTTLVIAFDKLPQPVKTFAVAVGAIAALAGPTLLTIGTLLTYFDRLAKIEAVSNGVLVLKSAFSALQPAVTAAVTAVKSFTVAFEAEKIAESANSIKSAFSGIGAAILAGVKDIPGTLSTAKVALIAFGTNAAGWLTTNASAIWTAVTGMFVGLGPKITAAIAGIGPMVTAAWGTITAAISGISWAGIAAGLEAAVAAVGSALSTLAAYASAAGPIGLVVAAVATIGAAAYAVYKNWEDIKPILIGIWKDIGAGAEWLAKWVLGSFDAVFGPKTSQAIIGIWSGIGQFFGGLWQSISSTMSAAFQSMLGTLSAFAKAVNAVETAKAIDLWIGKLDGMRGMAEAAAKNFQALANADQARLMSEGNYFQQAAGHLKSSADNMSALAAHTDAVAGKSATIAAHVEASAEATRTFGLAMLSVKTNTEIATDATERLRGLLANIAEQDAFKAMRDSLEDFRVKAMEASTQVPQYIKAIGDAALDSVKPFEEAATKIGESANKPLVKLGDGLDKIYIGTVKATKPWADFGREMGKAFDKFSDAIADGIIQWNNFGDTVVKAAEAIGKGLVKALIKDGLSLVAKEVLNLDGSFKTLGQTISNIFGGGGTEAAKNVTNAKNPLTSTANQLGGLTSMVTAVTSVVSAVTGVLGYIQGRHMEADIGKIEVTTRGELNQLISIQGTLNTYLPNLVNTQQLIRLEGIENALVKMAEGGSVGQMMDQVSKAIGDGLQAFGNAIQQGFQLMVTELGTLRQNTWNQLASVILILTTLYNTMAKPGWQPATSLPSVTPANTSTSNRNTSAPATTQSVTNVHVQATTSNPYNVGMQVAAGLNTATAIRL